MANEIEEYREYLTSKKLPAHTVRRKCAWASQQLRGAATIITHSFKVLEEWLHGIREEDG